MSRAKGKEIVRFATKSLRKPFIDNAPAPWYNKSQCGHGGIGRLGGFRFHCESVQVRVLLPAPKQYNPNQFFLSGRWVRIICFLREVRGDPLPKRRCQAAGIQAKRLIKRNRFRRTPLRIRMVIYVSSDQLCDGLPEIPAFGRTHHGYAARKVRP